MHTYNIKIQTKIETTVTWVSRLKQSSQTVPLAAAETKFKLRMEGIWSHPASDWLQRT